MIFGIYLYIRICLALFLFDMAKLIQADKTSAIAMPEEMISRILSHPYCCFLF